MTSGYAAPGGTNLEWAIDTLDVGNFLAMGKFDTGLPATWIEGGFGYDGVVDVLDVAEFYAPGLYDAGGYNSPDGSISLVPEPYGLWFIVVGAGALGAIASRRPRTPGITCSAATRA